MKIKSLSQLQLYFNNYVSHLSPLYIAEIEEIRSKDLKATHARSRCNACSQVEELFQLRHRILRIFHRVSNGSCIFEDFEVVSTLERLVAEKVDGRVVDAARKSLFVLNVLQAVSFIPALRENIEGDLTADGVSVRRKLATDYLGAKPMG